MNRTTSVFAVLLSAVCSLVLAVPAPAQDAPAAEPRRFELPKRFELMDVFQLEWASDPQISPDGARVLYLRNGYDLMADRARSELWTIGFDGSGHRPLVTGGDVSSPRISPDGNRVAYVASGDDGTELRVLYLDVDRTVRLAQLTEGPSSLAWSPDGTQLAFAMLVREDPEPLAKLPKPPAGAEWAEPPQVIERMVYRADGRGYLPNGHRHIFVLPAEGGTPRQVTSGTYDHNGTPSWTPDGKHLIFSANREEDRDLDPLDSELYQVDLETGAIRELTDRQGPDNDPQVSPDGRWIAYLGFDDRLQGYQVTRLHLFDRQTRETRVLTGDLDRGVGSPRWSPDGRAVYVLYDDRGNTKLARVGLDGQVTVVTGGVGGTSLGRPYASGDYAVGPDGRYAVTLTTPERPADLAVGTVQGEGAGEPRRVTALNEDLLAHRELARVEEIVYESSHDGRQIQGWIAYPPGFEAGSETKYPLLLEIHGGPFANYGDRFAAEIQLYAAAGYVVLYTNPRGSTSYGEEFGNLIHHAYPGFDYDDLMSGVDAVVARGYVDPERLYVTGGSGGGVLTAWIVGKTDRFRAAAVQKPVINWTSFVFTADLPGFFYKYWFPGLPWEHPEQYIERSPLFLAGNVETPTLIITGEVDYRTPISESEQLYEALKLSGVETALVRVPGAGHGIARRPSQLMAKVGYVLGWFGRYGGSWVQTGHIGVALPRAHG